MLVKVGSTATPPTHNDFSTQSDLSMHSDRGLEDWVAELLAHPSTDARCVRLGCAWEAYRLQGPVDDDVFLFPAALGWGPQNRPCFGHLVAGIRNVVEAPPGNSTG
ncbi:abh1 [Symbiodinium natans]|uniref:Abh1 protein n=1 Tax=Symbiodinium natans TaxID=878477 RepID=A0A812USE7_9DINO|nr:abh1 [Symbiodinium natans]